MSYLLYPLFAFLFIGSAFAQNLNCTAAAQPPLVRQEGLTERTGDIVLTCSGGTPNLQVTGNLTLFLSVNITNRVAPGTNRVTDVVFTADNGSGPQAVTTPGILSGPATLVYNGASFTLSSTGSVVLRIANVRANANQMSEVSGGHIGVFLSFSSAAPVGFTGNQLTVATPQTGLYVGFSSKILCSQAGSPLAANPFSFASFITAGSVYNSTRITEGFADSFQPRSGVQGLNADTGTRFIVTYSGFPAGARLFVPSVVAGSDAVQPTAGGDFGPPPSGGKFAPASNNSNGSLLLSLVQYADPTGAGGMPLYMPGAPGSGTVSFDAVSEIPLTGGAGFAVYEVVDADPFIAESAQFPTFLALAPFSGASVDTSENVTFAPTSSVGTASSNAPIPRFAASTPPADCSLVGDCGASYFPMLRVLESSVNVTAQAGSNPQAAFVIIQNASSGVLRWNAGITYQSGSGWVTLVQNSGINNSGIQLIVKPGSLSPGTYQATLTIDAGPIAGSRQIPVTLNITAAATPSPTVTSALNAATLTSGPLAPGSLATIMGSRFSGSNLSVTFDGALATILFSNDAQINLLVPDALASKKSAQVSVQVNGMTSASQQVALSPFAPGIFANGILNQDYSVNDAKHAAAPGSIIQIFATGLSGTGVITAKIGDQMVTQPYYAGAAPGLMGVQQVDLIVPPDLAGNSVAVSVCGGASADQVTCSPPVQLAVAQP
ncbi:MAG TPA: IPT/TIG domain-containing protein [Bryobacteraceae bacterium]|nr:IPT/TIG domain-containing protein [Bryobacteraceae bacterium]